MNLLSKAAPWVVASLLATTNVFGQQGQPDKARPQKSYEQGHELVQTQMMAAYNAPARIDVRGAWDFYTTGSFTYWQPIQENMELAISNSIAKTTNGILNGNLVNMNFDYSPGFKVGMGMNFDHDNWDGYVEYTWFRGSQSRTETNGTYELLWAAPIMQSGLGTGSNLYDNIHGEWRLKMDLLDAELARSYYIGTRLSVRPVIGARAGWIRQRMQSENTNNNFSGAAGHSTGTLGIDRITVKLQSWGVGPRTGMYTNWMLGQGFRLFGNGFADILYTRYTQNSHNETFTALSTGSISTFHADQPDYPSLRTHIDLELGFGWGSYFDNNNWHVDLVAGYAFQVFFDQNMMRHFDSGSARAVSTAPNGNLYMQGLNVSARFDF